MKKCKSRDCLDTGLIEFSVFTDIFNEYKPKNEFNNDDKKIFNLFIYNMKKNETKEQIGLFFLSYLNICNHLGIKDYLDNNSDKENINSNRDKGNYYIKIGEC